jgi:hypothetical protein
MAGKKKTASEDAVHLLDQY